MKTTRIALALLLATSLTGCGLSSSPSLMAATTSSASLSAESVDIDGLNANGILNDIDDETLTDLGPSAVAPASYGSQSLFGFFGTTKIGYVRSNTDGVFTLQTREGFFKKKDVSYSLSGSNQDRNLKIAKDLNDKVLVRGTLQGTSYVAKTVIDIPDLSLLYKLLKTGCVHGRVYDSKTLVALANAEVTIRSAYSGQIYRARTHSDGKYHVGFLVPGDYTVEVTDGGYSKGTLAKVTVAKRHAAEGNVPLTITSETAATP